MRGARILTALFATGIAASSCLDFGDLSGSTACSGAACGSDASITGDSGSDGDGAPHDDAGPTVFDGGTTSLTITCPASLKTSANSAGSETIGIVRQGFSGGVRISASAVGLPSTVITEVTTGLPSFDVPITNPPAGGFIVIFSATSSDGSLVSPSCTTTLVATGMWIRDPMIGTHVAVVPPGVTSMQAFAWGAGGGGGGGYNDTSAGKYFSGGSGGGGAAASLIFRSTPGEALTYRVGGPGAAGVINFPGGGGGGGYSDVASTSLGEVLLAAGGGGGTAEGTYQSTRAKGATGGAGGAATGQYGGSSNGGGGGGPGTQTTGGAGGSVAAGQGSASGGVDGASYTSTAISSGGAGGNASLPGTGSGAKGGVPGGGAGGGGGSSGDGAGGGGTGYFGGGGGGGASGNGWTLAGAGGGGSSFPLSANLAAGNGATPGVLVTATGYLLPNIGLGGAGATSSSALQQPGSGGLVVLVIQ